MHRSTIIAGVALATLTSGLAGCATAPNLYRGNEAYQLMASGAAKAASQKYRIGREDILKVTVLYEPDLSNAASKVDSGGNISVPLIGDVQAADRTTTEVSAEIASRLGATYVQNPRVNVSVETSAVDHVTIEGFVADPGVYPMAGSMSLLEALARAKSPTRIALLRDVAVFRMVNGRRVGGLFDVVAIRAGLEPDPPLVAGDVVVVGLSYVKSFYRDLLQTAPSVAAFAPRR